MALCEACQSILEAFFGPQIGPNVDIEVPHYPVTTLRRSAALGCPVCEVMAAGVNADFLPPNLQSSIPVMMQRAMIDPHQAFGLYVGIDDISNTFYFHVPPTWCKSTYLASFVKQNSLMDHILRAAV